MLILIGDNQTVNAQEGIVGPVVFGRPVGGGIITFQDIGLARTWQVTLPDSSFSPSSWSNDGCNLLLRGSNTWTIVSLPDATTREIPRLPLPDAAEQPFGEMIWSYDGKSLTETVYLKNNDVRIYSINLDTLAVELLLTLKENGGAVRWLSDTELLYQTRSGYYVWDTKAKVSYLYAPFVQVPQDQPTELYLSYVSPNQQYAARFYNLNALRSFVEASQQVPPSEDISPEYIATLEAVPKVPGFDIYTFADKTVNHVDVMGQFLQFLFWSPSSNQIVVTTDPRTTSDDLNGIYVYNLADKSLQRIGEFPALYNLEYGGYEPGWSPDSKWLAFNTPDGYVVYNLDSQETINLSDEFTGFYMRVQWSPIMDYSRVTC
jgi:hypothetical protein